MVNERRALDPRVSDILDRRGWVYLHALDEDGLFRVYSAGFVTNLAHPDVILSGVPPAEARQLLSVLRDHIKAGVMRYDHTRELELMGRRVMILPLDVDEARQVMPIAGVVAGGQFSAVQLVLADEAGRFPWSQGCVLPQRLFAPAPSVH